jgi:hypothetical protein
MEMNRVSKVWVCLLAVAIGFAAGGGQAARAGAAQPSDPASLLAAFARAVGDPQAIDTALGLVADDMVLRITPAPPGTPGLWTGKDEVRQALQYASENAVHGVLQGSPQVNGNTATATVMMSNRFLVAWGVAPVKFNTELVAEGGKIKSFTNTIAPEERQRVATAAQAYQAAQAGQAPAGMPRTGGSDPGGAPPALLVLGVLCLIAGVAARRRYAHA